jgi:hypothetical protein
VSRAVTDQRITVDRDGLIDPEVADMQWAKNTRARVSPQAVAGETADRSPDLVSQAAASPAPPAQTAPPANTPAPANGYTDARARRESADAERAEIEVQKMRRELVEAEDVDRAGFEIGRDLRDAMESSVNGLAAEVAAVTSADECADILRRHNRAICDVLARAWREKLGKQLPESAS